MVAFITRRALASLPVLLLITLVSFRDPPARRAFVASGQRDLGGDYRGDGEYYGLDRPLLLNLPGSPDWQLLHVVEEEVSERVEILNLSPVFKAALDAVTQAPVRAALGEAFAPALDRVAFYRNQGIRRHEMLGLLTDLAAIRETVKGSDSEFAAQIDAAITLYRDADLSRLTSPASARASVPADCSRASSGITCST
jgi:hypothetical protein